MFPRGLPTPGARPVERVSLEEALTRRWEDDRHIVLYTSSRPYRINNAALPKVGDVEVRLLAFDVDNHDGAPGWLESERPKVAALLSEHPGGFAYTTRRGWRVLYALPEPWPMRSEADKEAFARFYARVAGYVFRWFGIAPDPALVRWNQPIRLPHVVRDGEVFDAEILGGDAAELGAFELPVEVPNAPDLRALAVVLPGWGGVAKRWQPKRDALRVTSSATFEHVPLAPYAERLAAAESWARTQAPKAIAHHGGRATARSVAAMLHVGFALERADVERLLTGPYNRRCAPPWEEGELADLRGMAQTVARTPEQPWGFMVGRDRTGLEAARAVLAAAAESRSVVPLEDVGRRLVEAIEAHRAVVVRATYGAGKTHAMAEYIATQTTGRVVVVVPTHELARTWLQALAAAGESDVAHHASVVQRRDETTGRRECDHPLALPIYRHGGDVARDVCPSCPRLTTCPAYAARPSATARVQVVPREMIPKLEITGEDLVVVDDAATDVLAWRRLTIRQLRRLGGIDPRHLPAAQARLLRLFATALLAGPRRAEETARAGLAAEGMEGSAAAAAAERESALALLGARLGEGPRAPRVPRDLLEEEKGELTETLRDIARVGEVLKFARACGEGGRVRWSDGVWSVHGETPVAALLRSHTGRLVILDAAAQVEELGALRPDLHIERLDVEDAGEVTRTLLFTTHANRTSLREPARRQELLEEWLGAVLERLRARGARHPVFVVYKAHEAEVRKHPLVQAWLAEHPRRTVRSTHYGAVRGSNRFGTCDAVVTLGDPWLNGEDVLGRAAWLELEEPSYRIGLASAELGQAHGRSRAVRRRRRLTHLHVGRLVPEGWARGAGVEPLGGPPERAPPSSAGEFGKLVSSLGGNRAAGERLGYSSSAVAGWRAGARGLPLAVLGEARALVEGERENNPSVSSGEAARGARQSLDAGLYGTLLRGCVHPGEEVPASPADEPVRAPESVEPAEGAGGLGALPPSPILQQPFAPPSEGKPGDGARGPLLVELAEKVHFPETATGPSDPGPRWLPVPREEESWPGKGPAPPRAPEPRAENGIQAARIVAMLEALEATDHSPWGGYAASGRVGALSSEARARMRRAAGG